MLLDLHCGSPQYHIDNITAEIERLPGYQEYCPGTESLSDSQRQITLDATSDSGDQSHGQEVPLGYTVATRCLASAVGDYCNRGPIKVHEQPLGSNAATQVTVMTTELVITFIPSLVQLSKGYELIREKGKLAFAHDFTQSIMHLLDLVWFLLAITLTIYAWPNAVSWSCHAHHTVHTLEVYMLLFSNAYVTTKEAHISCSHCYRKPCWKVERINKERDQRLAKARSFSLHKLITGDDSTHQREDDEHKGENDQPQAIQQAIKTPHEEDRVHHMSNGAVPANAGAMASDTGLHNERAVPVARKPEDKSHKHGGHHDRPDARDPEDKRHKHGGHRRHKRKIRASVGAVIATHHEHHEHHHTLRAAAEDKRTRRVTE